MEDNKSRPLIPGMRLRVTFEAREDEDVLRWRASCNTFGADVEVASDSLLVGEITGTEMGCRDALQEQDEWLTDFFGSDPRWRLTDDLLTLTSGKTVIELEASRD